MLLIFIFMHLVKWLFLETRSYVQHHSECAVLTAMTEDGIKPSRRTNTTKFFVCINSVECWCNASDKVSHPIHERDELLVQGYGKIRNNYLALVSVYVQQPGQTCQSTDHHRRAMRTRLLILDCVVTRI